MTYQLIGIAGEQKGSIWPVPETGLVFGRGKNCDVVIADPAVSRRHCRILRGTNQEVRIEDLGSQHPALVNGYPLLHGQLHPKDEIAIGTEVFLVAAALGPVADVQNAQPKAQTASWPDLVSRLALETPEGGRTIQPRTLKDLLALYEMTQRFGSASTGRELMARLIECLSERFAPDRQWVARVHRDCDMSFCPTPRSLEDPAAGAPRELMCTCLEERRSMLAPRSRQNRAHAKSGTVLAAPVLFNEYPLGVVAVENTAPGAYCEADLHMLTMVAGVLAPFVHAVETTEQLRRDYAHLRARTGDSLTLVGRSRGIRHVRGEIAKAGRSPLHVLILGETGTGKELVARSIHAASARCRMPLVVVNCAAIPRDLFESQLFGHEKGAFTGAESARPGLLAQAHGGTLFLDEVADLSLDNQARILRTIETGAYRRVGAETESYADFRVLAATNKDLHAAVANGAFRSDLYHRLNGFEIHVPPLRKHPSDIPRLAEHFFQIGRGLAKRPLKGISEEAMKHLTSHAWPGNVRELRNVIMRAIGTTTHETVQLRDVKQPEAVAAGPVESEEIPLSLAAAEKRHIAAALQYCNGDIRAAAQLLEVSRSTLYRKIAAYGLRRNR